MKKVKYPKLSDYDLSAYEELKGDILYRINGGTEIENSNDAVANAKVGDTLTRSNGEVVVITEEHIQWARDHGGKVLEGMDDGTPNSGDDGGSCVEPTESEKPAPSVENGSNTKNSSNNAGILSSNNNLKIPTTSNASSIQVASGANSAGRTNVNAGSNAAGTGSQAAVNSSRPSGVPGGVKGNTVTGKPIAGCVIEHTDDDRNIIKVSWNDKMALKEAEDKFLAYTNGGFDCRLEVYTANGSARVFNTYSDFVKDKTIQQTPVDYSINKSLGKKVLNFVNKCDYEGYVDVSVGVGLSANVLGLGVGLDLGSEHGIFSLKGKGISRPEFDYNETISLGIETPIVSVDGSSPFEPANGKAPIQNMDWTWSFGPVSVYKDSMGVTLNLGAQVVVGLEVGTSVTIPDEALLIFK